MFTISIVAFGCDVAAMPLFKILRRPEWHNLEAAGRFDGSADDLRDGFIHLSDSAQLPGTLAAHFAGESDLVIAEVAVDHDPALRWEKSRSGMSFPHLYRPLLLGDVVATICGAP